MRRKNSLRLQGYDYSSPGAYFITMCVQDRVPLFGRIQHGKMILSLPGQIVHDQWIWLHQQYRYLILDCFVVMPDHVHVVLVVAPGMSEMGCEWQGILLDGCDHHRSRQIFTPFVKIKPVPELIGAFKMTSSKLIHRAGYQGFRWQRGYYDHIIRDSRALERIREYIINNPRKTR